MTDWTRTGCSASDAEFCRTGSVVTLLVKDGISISKSIYSLWQGIVVFWDYSQHVHFKNLVHKCNGKWVHDTTIRDVSVIFIKLFLSVLQAKNRELLKQVAALSKGKKFDKSGSILTSPWGTAYSWGLLLNVNLSNSVKPLKACVVEKIFLHTRLVGMFPTRFYN